MNLILSKCDNDSCDPVEQIRGEVHNDDSSVEMNGEIASDMRIACPKCGKTTGWDRVDLTEVQTHGPGDKRHHVTVRDGNKDAIRVRWNEMVTAK